jgi:tetratricopeptide (TPR) repeat protein
MTRAWIGLALVLLTLLVYAQVRRFPFINFDDAQYVAENAPVAAGVTGAGIRWAFSSAHAGNWHPLTWISHMADVELFGLDAGLHHVTNVVVHVLGTLLLFVVFERMTQQPWPSAFVAAMFGVHPTHVESVAWIAERKDVLSGFFWILTMWTYARYASAPSWQRYAAVVAAFIAGLLSKPMVVTLPFALLLLDVWPLGRLATSAWRFLVVEKVPLVIFSVASSIVTFVVQREAGAVRALDVLPFGRRLAAATVGYVEYMVKTLWPTDLAVLYPHPAAIPAWQWTAAAVVLVTITAAACWTWRARPYFAVGWFWFAGTLIPVIGLVQVGTQRIADRYLYIPSIGLFVILAWGTIELARRVRIPRRAIAIVAFIAVASASVLARQQVQYWRSSVALWEHTLEVTDENSRAHAHLGHALSAEARHDEAIAQFQRALALRPDYPEALNYLGAALARRGEAEAAIPMFRRAVELSPALPHARANLATALAQSGQIEAAIREYREVVREAPDDLQSRANLGRALIGKGLADEGSDHLLYVTMALLDAGRIDEALEALEVVLRAHPNHPKARPLLEELAARARRSRR